MRVMMGIIIMAMMAKLEKPENSITCAHNTQNGKELESIDRRIMKRTEKLPNMISEQRTTLPPQPQTPAIKVPGPDINV